MTKWSCRNCWYNQAKSRCIMHLGSH
ncbi:TPA: hypothetical protein MIG31_19065 [Klebsiella pneumoniae]|nr:hypothetical protein [Klebsiella pneumoniae]